MTCVNMTNDGDVIRVGVACRTVSELMEIYSSALLPQSSVRDG